MKKILLGLTVLAVSTLPSSAQNSSDKDQTTCPVRKECTKAKACNAPEVCAQCPGPDQCNDCSDCKGCIGGKVCVPCKGSKNAAIGWGRGKCPGFRILESLNLSESQKSQIQELNKNWQANADKWKASKDQIKGNSDDFRAKRQENKRKYLDEVKKILTPKQYTQFLEKSYLDNNGKKFAHNGKHGRKGHDGRKNNKRHCNK